MKKVIHVSMLLGMMMAAALAGANRVYAAGTGFSIAWVQTPFGGYAQVAVPNGVNAQQAVNQQYYTNGGGIGGGAGSSSSGGGGGGETITDGQGGGGSGCFDL